jgi:hypothetical protein
MVASLCGRTQQGNVQSTEELSTVQGNALFRKTSRSISRRLVLPSLASFAKGRTLGHTILFWHRVRHLHTQCRCLAIFSVLHGTGAKSVRWRELRFFENSQGHTMQVPHVALHFCTPWL